LQLIRVFIIIEANKRESGDIMTELEMEFYINYSILIKEITPKRKRALRKVEALRLSNEVLLSLIKIIENEKGLGNIDNADAYNALLIAKLLTKIIETKPRTNARYKLWELCDSIRILEELGKITKEKVKQSR